jgi:disulfide oxidoreductase YuzD
MFGDRVQVLYLDVADPQVRANAAGVVEGARQRHLPYPLVAIDGQVVLAGKADAESVLRKLGEVLAGADG